MYGFEPYNDTNATWSAKARAAGFHYMREADVTSTDAADPYLLAYVNPIDEPDIHTPDAYAASIQTYQYLKSINPNIPVMNTYSGGKVIGWESAAPTVAQYQSMFAATDWMAAAMYPVTGWNMPENTAAIGLTLDKAKAAAPGKRQFAYIETGNQHLPWTGPNERGVTPDEFRGEIWNAVIHGANGIVYFPDALVPFWIFISASTRESVVSYENGTRASGK